VESVDDIGERVPRTKMRGEWGKGTLASGGLGIVFRQSPPAEAVNANPVNPKVDRQA